MIFCVLVFLWLVLFSQQPARHTRLWQAGAPKHQITPKFLINQSRINSKVAFLQNELKTGSGQMLRLSLRFAAK